MHLRVWKILEEGFAAFAREEYVVQSPEDDRLRLVLLQKRLPLRVKLYVRPVVVEKSSCAPRVGPIEIVQIHVPVVRADQLGERLFSLGRPSQTEVKPTS